MGAESTNHQHVCVVIGNARQVGGGGQSSTSTDERTNDYRAGEPATIEQVH